LPIVQTYYAQRAESLPKTLLISEATYVSPQGSGYANVPGLWTPEQLASWKKVTDVVHAKGGYIFAQLWFLGRAAGSKELAKKGLQVVSSSATRMSESHKEPVAMSEEVVWRTVGEYATAAKNAVEVAGFDGVEIHGANGYLVDQFTQSNCNTRTDKWGGSIENRSRFAIEVAKAVTAAVGADRTGIRLSPYSEFQGMRMPTEGEIQGQFKHLIGELRKLNLAYLHMTTPRVQGGTDVKEPKENMDWAVKAWGPDKPLILAGAFRPDTAKAEVDVKWPEYQLLIGFGRLWISTPDLPYRIKNGIPLTRYDRDTFYLAMSEKGYTDYPFSEAYLAQKKDGAGQPML
jgi:NADPH2 dehydrogenase